MRHTLGWGISAIVLSSACASGSNPPVTHPARVCSAPESGIRPAFEFRSGFWVNLKNVLFARAKALRGIQDEGLGGLGQADLMAMGAAPDSASQAAWDALVEEYAALALDRGLGPDAIRRINVPLSDAAWPGTLADVDVNPELEDLLLRAAPLYAAHWWSAHDAWNRDWIRTVQAERSRVGACAEPRLAHLLRGAWSSEPIPVDATVYANWFGAFTVVDPPHVTLSSNGVGNQGISGYESLLHEAAHTLLRGVDTTLRDTGETLGRRVPRQTAHLLLFYTVGSVMRELVQDYVPNGRRFGIWDQNATARAEYRRFHTLWWPWLGGRVEFEEAIHGLVDSYPRVAAEP